MICWYCYWGWPEVIYEIYMRAANEIGSDPLHWGPAHVVWEDENFTSAERCLENFEEFRGKCTDEELAVVRRSLEELAEVPLEIRDIAKEYEDAAEDNPNIHPKDYPPPPHIKMIS